MGSTTEWVKRALTELGSGATDQAVKRYIREKDPSVPEGQISLALRKLRRKVNPVTKDQGSTNQARQKAPQADLFSEE
jgi:hypothetical protein